jgi:hypothetical protein
MSGDTFMGFIELNERAWGTDSYPGRPRLEAILRARVVAFWQSNKARDPAYRVTVHENITEIHHWATDMLIASKTRVPDRRLVRLYVDKRRVRIKGVRILIEEGSQTP